MSRTTKASRFVLTSIRSRSGSNAAPPQATPPTLPGKTSVPPRLGGVNIPS